MGFLDKLFGDPYKERLEQEARNHARIAEGIKQYQEKRKAMAKFAVPPPPPKPKVESEDAILTLTKLLAELTAIVRDQDSRIRHLEGRLAEENKEEALATNPEYGTF